MQVIYHGHSFIEIERENSSILIDPFVSHNPRCDITLDDIIHKSITHILLTHVRDDALDDIMTIVKSTWCTLVAITDICEIVQSHAIIGQNIISQSLDSLFTFEDWSVQFTKSLHDISTTGHSSGLIIDFLWIRIYHAGDTQLFDEMSEIQDIDLALLPIGGTYTMGVEDAVKACWYIKPKTVVPIHYNTNSTLKADDIEFARQVMLAQYAVPKVLRAGQYIVL